MRRREKFVIASLLLSLGLLAVQYVSLEFRYLAVALFGAVSYLVSAWALSDDLQHFEWLTIIPFPASYAIAVSLFYFLLPSHPLTRVIILGLFAVGMYGVYLACNIYSVAKGRTIQLLHAARAVATLFTLLISWLLLNTIFSLRLPFYLNGILVAVSQFPLVFFSLWSIQLEQAVPKNILYITLFVTIILMEVAMVFSFLPLSVWNSALFTMSVLYLALGIIQNFLQDRLFKNIIVEFSLVGALIISLFIILFPGK